MRNAHVNSEGRKVRVRSSRRFAIGLGLAAVLVLAACGGSSSDDSIDTDQVGADIEAVTDAEQETPPPTTVVEVPEVADVTEVPDDEATTEVPVPAEGTTPEPTSELPAWTTFTTADGLATNDVVALDVHADGTTWAMTVTPGEPPFIGMSLSRFDGDTWTTFDVPERFTTGPLTLGQPDLTDGLAAGPNGTAWYLAGGLWEFDGDSWTTVHDCDSSQCSEVPGMALDVGGDGVLWSAGSKRLLRRDGDEWTTIAVPSNTDMMVPWTGFDSPRFGYGVDSDGVVWVLTLDGLASYDGEWHDHPVADGTLYGNQGMYGLTWWTLGSDDTSTTLSLDVTDFAEMPGNPILTAVSIFDGDEWTNTDRSFEIDSDSASLTSGNGEIKIATIPNEHLFVGAGSMFSRDQATTVPGGLLWSDYQAGTRTMLTVEDGLPSENIRDLADSPDGVMWIATDAGIARFVPGSTAEAAS